MIVAKRDDPSGRRISAMMPVNLLARYCPDHIPLRLATSPSFHEYWEPLARGVEKRMQTGWYFSDRRRATTELVEWLTQPPSPGDNIRVIIGGPGSGKSSVLAQFVARSDAGFNRRHPCDPDDPLVRLPVNTVHAAIPAGNLDFTRIVQLLGEAIGAEVKTANDLITAMSERETSPVFVIDGLDESVNPRAVASDLYQLAFSGRDLGLRLLVGTRPGHQGELKIRLDLRTTGSTINLDTDRYLDRTGLSDYVLRRLLSDPRSPYSAYPERAARLAAAVAESAFPTFLVAVLTVGALIYQKVNDADEREWDRFPTDLSAAMGNYLQRFPEPDDLKVEELLRPLAYTYAQTGLPPGKLWVALANALADAENRYDEDAIDWLLRNAADYVTAAVPTPPIVAPRAAPVWTPPIVPTAWLWVMPALCISQLATGSVAGIGGALRREHAVFRDRCRRRVPRTGVLQLCRGSGYARGRTVVHIADIASIGSLGVTHCLLHASAELYRISSELPFGAVVECAVDNSGNVTAARLAAGPYPLR